MKLSIISVLFCTISCAYSFSFSSIPSVRSPVATDSKTQLFLFGGKKDGGEKKPGMMDQIAMLKKAQEVASKKMAMDKELAKEDHVGSGADGKVKVTIKYIPPPPMQQPGYDGSAVDIDEDYLASATSEELSAAVAEAIKDGYQLASTAVTQKMAELTVELGKMMGEMQKPQES
mmetsp:Transcript_48946/g.72766  ORF Transcript_48946/g.72766 Transcript_48946/m.72766 type:complete len:174 (-) Transcript_48946:358-879(-)|eukprot:CAMPEP_0195527512 /NCGR_PEP_ID=MMETSP0794_2-20130614/29229_1 /TAXON_ID=515487 /ORGANISM="Stephanopyxis turris, Strain CCMP 815" /LENGTH=173 /DNA_ID=CAMNT_0040658433 /DNA_START=117 /DNA_END=641 /DNA_ORIENTATION=+